MRRKVESRGNYLIIDGDYYVPDKIIEDGSFTTSEIKWKQVNMKGTEKMIEKLAEKLKNDLPAKIVVADALRAIDMKTLREINKKMKAKKKPKIKTEKHCVRMDIGGIKLPIRG